VELAPFLFLYGVAAVVGQWRALHFAQVVLFGGRTRHAHAHRKDVTRASRFGGCASTGTVSEPFRARNK
jgi:hypothetical protein